MYPFYLGIDLPLKRTYVALMDTEGEVIDERFAKRCGKWGARIAVARRLLTVIYYMLKRDQPYQEDYHRGA